VEPVAVEESGAVVFGAVMVVAPLSSSPHEAATNASAAKPAIRMRGVARIDFVVIVSAKLSARSGWLIID